MKKSSLFVVIGASLIVISSGNAEEPVANRLRFAMGIGSQEQKVTTEDIKGVLSGFSGVVSVQTIAAGPSLPPDVITKEANFDVRTKTYRGTWREPQISEIRRTKKGDLVQSSRFKLYQSGQREFVEGEVTDYTDGKPVKRQEILASRPIEKNKDYDFVSLATLSPDGKGGWEGTKVVKEAGKPEATEEVKSDATAQNDGGVHIYTNLSAGFLFTSAQRTSTVVRPLRDGAGNIIQRDGQNVGVVTSDVADSTISTSLTGLVHIAYDMNPNWKKGLKGWPLLEQVNGYGFTFGSGLSNGTSGTLEFAPFIGLSLFTGENNSVALTFGQMWVPSQVPRDYRFGDQILGDQITSRTTYGSGGLFLGLTYRILGQGTNSTTAKKPKEPDSN